MIITTTRCGKFGHPAFVLEADESIVPDQFLRTLAEGLESMVAGGSVFRHGETFQYGSILTCRR